jgi:hypothetical protein
MPRSHSFEGLNLNTPRASSNGQGSGSRANGKSQARPVDAALGPAAGITFVANTLQRRDSGTLLPHATRRAAELRFNTDLRNVRVHDGPAARAAARLFGLEAFTIGKDVYLGDGIRLTTARERDPRLEHELIHAAQQRPWKGEALALAPRDGPHEREARHLSEGKTSAATTAQPRITASPPAVMGLAPWIAALIAGELACIYGFFHYALTKYGHKGDGWQHCWTSCKIATWCPPVPLTGQIIAALIGALKELADITIGSAEVRDLVNNGHGIACSADVFTSCWDCCEDLKKSGKLAAMEPERGSEEPTAIASRGAARADGSPSGDEAAALVQDAIA